MAMLTVMALTTPAVIKAAEMWPVTTQQCDENTIVEIPIIENKNIDITTGDRSIAINVTAFYLPDRKVEINCFNIGITNVTLYGPMGIPVDTYTFDSNSEPMVVLYVPSDSGTYRIVIDADKYSGEGEFEVR